MSRWLLLLIATVCAGCTADADGTAGAPGSTVAEEAPSSTDVLSSDDESLSGSKRSTPPALDDGAPTRTLEGDASAAWASSNAKPESSKESSRGTKDPTPYQALSHWIGEYPVLEDGTHFVTQPAVVLFLEDAFAVESGLMSKLSALATEPVLLAEPIEYVGGAFALEFVPNEGVGQEDRSLYVLIDGETGTTYAVLNGDDNAYYRSSYGARVADLAAEAVAWMREVSGEDIRALGRMSENAPISP
ncbi:hypothetical protein [Rubrivirga sp.]|uniref:hypothetical protein n=1 Tax=Rubrivirga sp. TaxID=1885344 RepID=UPI003C7719B7